MYQTTITEKEAGQRFDKYLRRILPAAGSSFLYKMLRKKNITLNGRKADGSEKIVPGDKVIVYFSEDTLAKFGLPALSKKPEQDEIQIAHEMAYGDAYRTITGVKIIYENRDILLADKPVGVLSQKAEKTVLSLNEWLIGYLLHSGTLSQEELAVYRPSVCNRLDRNTSGIVLCSKSLRGAQLLGELLKNRSLHKYYQLYVKGTIKEEQFIEGWLRKDVKHNKVFIEPAGGGQTAREQESYIKTGYRPIRTEQDKTLLEVELFTGKPHQIRAHLASIGHPLLGDYKYGDRAWNEEYRKKYHVNSQLLHAYKVVFPILGAPFEDISGRTFCTALPTIFQKVSDVKQI